MMKCPLNESGKTWSNSGGLTSSMKMVIHTYLKLAITPSFVPQFRGRLITKNYQSTYIGWGRSTTYGVGILLASDEPEVWAYVQWYYSGADANKLTDTFDRTLCSNYERIISDAYDYVSSSSFEDVVKVKRYYEDSLEQKDIEDAEFFYRYRLGHRTKEISRFTHQDDPGEVQELLRTPGSNTCICKNPYSPSATSVLMHFCPRPSCRRWYHAKCLKGIKSMLKLKNTDPEAGRRYLATSPFTDASMRLPGDDDVPASRPTKKRRTNHTVTITPIDNSQDPECRARYEALPDDLLEAAQQPIVKGRALGSGHIVGNIRLVALARKAVYEIIDGDELEDDWEQTINPNAALVHQSFTRFSFVCVTCSESRSRFLHLNMRPPYTFDLPPSMIMIARGCQQLHFPFVSSPLSAIHPQESASVPLKFHPNRWPGAEPTLAAIRRRFRRSAQTVLHGSAHQMNC
ncbi:hypothetical protein AB1N83_004510 [Pleurotus pulmonarius]